MPRKDLWSRDELVVVLDLYVRKGHAQHDPEVAEIAKLTGRSERSVAMRLGNFMHVDPRSPNEGLMGGWAQCDPLFKEFDGKSLRLSEEVASARQRLSNAVLRPHLANVVSASKAPSLHEVEDMDFRLKALPSFREPFASSQVDLSGGCASLIGCLAILILFCGLAVAILTHLI